MHRSPFWRDLEAAGKIFARKPALSPRPNLALDSLAMPTRRTLRTAHRRAEHERRRICERRRELSELNRRKALAEEFEKFGRRWKGALPEKELQWLSNPADLAVSRHRRWTEFSENELADIQVGFKRRHGKFVSVGMASKRGYARIVPSRRQGPYFDVEEEVARIASIARDRDVLDEVEAAVFDALYLSMLEKRRGRAVEDLALETGFSVRTIYRIGERARDKIRAVAAKKFF